MKFENVSILGVTHVDAPVRISSKEIGGRLAPVLERFGMGPGLIEALTGIVARRFWEPGVTPSQAATMAAEKLFNDTGLDRKLMGAMVSTSVCRDYIEPSTACLVHGALGLSDECINFDVANACLGFLNGMEIVGHMIDRNQIDYGLVVDGESSRFPVETTITRLLRPEVDENMLRDNFATLTLGSGSAAMILARSDLVPDGHRMVGGVNLADTRYNRLCLGQPDCMVTDASMLLKAGLVLAEKTWKKAVEELGWDANYLDEILVHQVSSAHTTKLMQLLGLPAERFFLTYPEFGNVGPANIPMMISKSLEEGRMKKGDKVGLLGIGSGLNCAMMEIAW